MDLALTAVPGAPGADARQVGKVQPARQVTPNFKAERPAKTKSQPSPATRAAVMARCGGWCELGTFNCDGRATQLHHKHRRSQGGGHDASNLMGTCDACHTWLHNNVAIAKERGWLR